MLGLHPALAEGDLKFVGGCVKIYSQLLQTTITCHPVGLTWVGDTKCWWCSLAFLKSSILTDQDQDQEHDGGRSTGEIKRKAMSGDLGTTHDG